MLLSRAARSEVERWEWRAATAELARRYEQLVARPSPRHGSFRRQLARFAAVGAANALVDVGVFNLLMLLLPTRSSWQLVAYNTLAVAAAIVNSYLWNSRWTFRESIGRRHAKRRERVLFALQSGLNLGVNDAVLGGTATLLRHSDLFSPVVGNNLAKLLAMFLASTVSFGVMKLIVFR